MFALGFISVTITATRLGKKYGIKEEDIVNCALTNFVGGVIGARLYFVALKWDYFKDHLNQICATWLGGLSIHGGVIGAIIASILYCRLNKLPFFTICDILAACLPLAQAIGRWGNFFNSELFGQPVPDNFPIKLFIPLENRPANATNFEYFHPTFLYESIWNLGLFFILYFYVIRRFKKYPFLTSLVYIGGYNIGRLLIEPLRMDSIMYNGIQTPMIASAIALGASILGIIFVVMRAKSAKKLEN
jgi:phosphatidylglycerol:prolipoprotein diacylglycerol transferase